jgi:hypothetical protein
MLPRLIEMVVRIIPPCVVPDPTVILRVNVRRVRMPLLILVRSPLLSLLLRRLSAPILPAPTLIASRLLISRLLIIALRLLLCLSLLLLPLLRRRIPRRLRPPLRYMPLADSLLSPAPLLLLCLLTSLLLWVLLLLLLFFLLPASILRKDSLGKRRHPKHRHRNNARKHSRKPFHALLQSRIRTRVHTARTASPVLKPKVRASIGNPYIAVRPSRHSGQRSFFPSSGSCWAQLTQSNSRNGWIYFHFARGPCHAWLRHFFLTLARAASPNSFLAFLFMRHP